MNFCVIVTVFCFSSLVSALPVGQNGMVFYHMPYYNPYQTMLMHYMPSSRSASTSAFASGDAVAAGTIIRENRVHGDASRAYNQQEAASNNDGNVEAIAEAYPEEPIQGAVQFDQTEEQYNDVIPLNAAPVSEDPKESSEIVPEQKITVTASEEPQIQTTVAPKKKVHIALDIPNSNSNSHDETENDDDDDDEYPYAAQKPSRKNSAPVYTYFPVSFGRAAGGTIAVANALSMGKGAVRSHAIAYGASGQTRRQQAAAERHVSAAQKTA